MCFQWSNQAIQLRYLPRLAVNHTSDVEQGQIYLPLLIGCCFLGIDLVVLFKTSANLASAYGVAVTMTMLCGTILISVLAYWILALASLERWLCSPFHFTHHRFGFCGVNLIENPQRVVGCQSSFGAVVFTIADQLGKMVERLYSRLEKDALPMDLFIKSVSLSRWKPFLCQVIDFLQTGTPNIMPHAMLHNIKHNKVLHERNIMIAVISRDIRIYCR